MTREEWNKWLEEALRKTKEVLLSKDSHYGRENDRFHNFNVAARVNDTPAVTEAWSMATKQLVAILDIIEDVREGRPPGVDLPRIEEVFGDMRNYLFLIEGMLVGSPERSS